MHIPGSKTILAAVNDLFFSVKISDAAKRAGMPVEFVKEADQVLMKAGEQPQLIIFDLNFDQIEPLKLIEQIKGDPKLKKISLIGYLSHIQGELKLKAQETGCDVVMARSAFSQNLPQILKRHSGHL
jgi:CheY-like chemotaxis protein